MAAIPPSLLSLPGEPRLQATAWEKENARRLQTLALVLVALGLTWRFLHYLLRFPVWGDEAMLLVNYFSRGYLDLLGPIDNCQVAPILFHWGELTVFRWLGSSELAVRFLPFLACLGSVALFWRLAHLALPPLARTIAIGILSVSIWPATMGALTKPYAGDLFFALLLLVLAVSWLRRPDRLWSLLLLVAVVPVAVLASYPSVFIAGAVSMALLPVVWQQRERKVVALFVLYNLLLVGTFAGHYFAIGLTHLSSPVHWVNHGNATTADGMRDYWAAGFPPHRPLAFLVWFFVAHTGQMAAYPIGTANGGSSLTVLFATIGLWYLYRQRQYRLLTLVVGAFGLWFIAGALQRYPYGSSGRVSQHGAPFYCLLAGLGVAVLIQRAKSLTGRWRATLVVVAVLVLVGAGGIVRDLLRPYRDDDALWARKMTNNLMQLVGDDPLLVPQNTHGITAVFQWQLGIRGPQVVPHDRIDWVRMGQTHSSLWVFFFGDPSDTEQEELQLHLAQSNRPWRCDQRLCSICTQRRLEEALLHCRVYHMVREENPSGKQPIFDFVSCHVKQSNE